jgi:cell division protein FtsN
MKDYAKLVNNPREMRSSEKVQPQEQPNLVRSAKERQPKENQGNKNVFAILLVLFILAVVGYGILRQYFATHHIDFSTGKITTEISKIKKSAAAATQSVPQFDFYTVLPKGSTLTSTSAPSTTNNAPSTSSAPASATPPASAPTPAPVSAPVAQPAPAPVPTAPVTTINVSSNVLGNKYFLNVGDYSTNDDAQKMLSQLLLLGVQANVAPKQDNGVILYEVLVGPFSDSAAINVVKNQLNSHQINTVTVQ